MKTAKYFDVYDKDVTPAIHAVLFSDIIVEKYANDQWYGIQGMEEDGGWEGMTKEEFKWAEDLWQKRLKRESNGGYHDKGAMKKFLENPCTALEAVLGFIEWLKERGVDTKEDIVFVKVWW